MASIHQVNHPGTEIEINYRSRASRTDDYYFFPGSKNKGVRLWNRGATDPKPNQHYRKFIEHEGKYVDSISKGTEKSGLLRFWGEYEGHSEFELLNRIVNVSDCDNPYELHKPFFCYQRMKGQNTDPYVFGDNFYYAVCKKNKLKNISPGDLILFGSEFGPAQNVKFYLDTLFVVDREQPCELDNSIYDITYQESTLKRIGVTACSRGDLPIHMGKKFSSDNSPFSFFPAKLAENYSFGRPVIDAEKLGLRKPGARTGSKSKRLSSGEYCEDIWNQIADTVLKQGFVLGTHANPLPILNDLP